MAICGNRTMGDSFVDLSYSFLKFAFLDYRKGSRGRLFGGHSSEGSGMRILRGCLRYRSANLHPQADFKLEFWDGGFSFFPSRNRITLGITSYNIRIH